MSQDPKDIQNNDASLIHWTLGGPWFKSREILKIYLHPNGSRLGKNQLVYMTEYKRIL